MATHRSNIQIVGDASLVSFILLTYGAIETILAYANTKKKSVFFVAGGLIMLAFGEFIAWTIRY